MIQNIKRAGDSEHVGDNDYVRVRDTGLVGEHVGATTSNRVQMGSARCDVALHTR